MSKCSAPPIPIIMLCDFYELTMSNGYFRNGYKDRITYFDLFFRQVPDGGGFATHLLIASEAPGVSS